MDAEDEMTALNVKLPEEELHILQHGLPPIIGNEIAPNEKNNDPESAQKDDQKTPKKSKWNEDTFNILMLLTLYIFQGIPSGLTFSIPLILSSRKVSYSDQGTFSFALWPFSVRLFWAPIVDSIFITKIGRRKTWIVSCFFSAGVIMISVAEYVHNILQANRPKESQDIYILTLIFGVLIFLIATQDIALDAWSLDLLLEKNVGWQSICNSVGVGLGGFLGGALFLTLESEKFANQYIRPLFKIEPKNYGIITIKEFCYSLGVLYIVTSLCILFFKNEHNKRKVKLTKPPQETKNEKVSESDQVQVKEKTKSPKPEGKRSILEAYKLVWSILKLSSIRKLIFIFLTVRIGFSTEGVVRLKLVEMGVEREKISLLSVLISPILSMVPFMVRKYINGPRPLDAFRTAYLLKMLAFLITLVFVYYVPYFKDETTNTFSYLFYILFFVISLVGSMISFVNWVSMGAFCAKISDKAIGGTYLTFLGFWLSLGSNWSKTASLYVISWLTFKSCVPRGASFNVTMDSVSKIKCYSDTDQKMCVEAGGQCVTTFDGFYAISLVLVVVALMWLILTRRMINYLQGLPSSSWCVIQSPSSSSGSPSSN